jgi:hypothetical protein
LKLFVALNRQTCCAKSKWPRFKESVSNSRRSIVLYGEAFDPATGRVDQSKLYGGLAQSGLGSQIPGLQKAEFERRKTEFATSKEQSEAALKRIEFKRTQLKNVSTPDAYVQWSLSSFDDPVLAPILKEIGSTP